MSDLSDFFSFLALVMAAIGIFVALLARRDSKRSANAAEKSAIEAKKTAALSQSGLLAQHFLNIDYVFDVAEEKREMDDYVAYSEAARQSSGFVKNIIHDAEFNKLMEDIFSIFNERPISVYEVLANEDSDEKRARLRQGKVLASQLRPVYEAIKQRWLKINITSDL